jgi:hypothetical protein
MLELTPQQIELLQRLRARGFDFVAFPMYERHIGARKGNCAALLEPVADAGMKIFGEPCYLVAGHLSVRATRRRRPWFVWKEQKVEATPERLAELAQFVRELSQALAEESGFIGNNGG